MYEQGDGLPQNDQKAAEWILKAAELGDSEAMYYAAMYYALGKGVRQNRPLYNEWIEKSAKAGYSDAVQQMKTGFSFANSSSTYSSPSENEQWNEYHRKNDEAREMRNRNGIGNSGSPYGY